MRVFYAIVNKDEGSAYGVHFPDVPGCFSASDDTESLLANASDALICHMDGEEVPEARDIQAIRKEGKEDLENGAFILAVPYVIPAARTVRANISLDEGTLNAIDAAARNRNMTRSVFIAHSSRREIEGRIRQVNTKIISTNARRYTIEARQSVSGMCKVQVVVSTHNNSRSEHAVRESSSYAKCIDGIKGDYLKEESVLKEVETWLEELSAA